MRGIWLGLWVAGTVCVGGCSGTIDPAEDCIEEFVQEFHFEDGSARGTGHCDGQDLSGPPEYPVNSTDIRIEYTNGRFFTVQKKLVWQGEQNPDNLNCQLMWQQKRMVYIENFFGKEEFVALRDGESIQDDRTRRLYRASVLYGGHRGLVTIKGQKTTHPISHTEFGIDCALTERPISQWSDYGDACMPISPKKQCRAHELMLPIHVTGEINGTPVSGKTTSFKYGKAGTLVDPTKWSMPGKP